MKILDGSISQTYSSHFLIPTFQAKQKLFYQKISLFLNNLRKWKIQQFVFDKLKVFPTFAAQALSG